MTAPTPAPLTTGSIASMLAAELVGRADLPITHADALDRAGPGAISFIRSHDFARRWGESRASAALVTRGIDVPGHDPASRALLRVADADVALVRLLEAIAPPPEPRTPGVHPAAIVDPAAAIAPSASVGPRCVVGRGATIADHATLFAGAYVGAEARIGAGSVLHPGVVVMDRCVIGARCILHANAVIGADGFGYVPAPRGHPAHPGLLKVPHVGNVVIEDDVEIGVGSAVDRAKFGSTRVGAGTKIDNLVQIGHGVIIGRSCILCGQVGLAGSAVLGDGVVLGGQAAVVDGVRVGSGAQLSGQSAATRDVPAGARYAGTPAQSLREFVALQAAVKRLVRPRNDPRLSASPEASSAGPDHASP